MKKCKYCEKKLNKIKQILPYKYCSFKCEYLDYEKWQDNMLKNDYIKLKNKYEKKETKKNEIQVKIIKLYHYEDSHDTLLKIINKWKNVQDPTLRIIDIKTWKIESKYEVDCKPWTAKIIYEY